MKFPSLGDLRFGQRATGRDDPVAVAVLVPTAQRERSLDVGAEETLTENPLAVPEQLCEELIEIDVRDDDEYCRCELEPSPVRGSAYEKLIKALRLHDSTQIVAASGSCCGTAGSHASAVRGVYGVAPWDHEGEIWMSQTACYSVIVDRPAADVWDVVRDFNSYPIWVNGVDESHIEEDLSGTAVGAVGNFALGGARRRQRLVAHSDVDRFFTYESCDPLETEVSGTVRSMAHYRGTLRLRPVVEGARCLAEWSAGYDCPPGDVAYWAEWWAAMLPTWLGSLRVHISGQPSDAGNACRNPFGVQDVPRPDGEDVTAFASGVRLTGSADDDNAGAWDAPSAAAPVSMEGNWSSRWRGDGFDWQMGHGRLSVDRERVYIMFDWEDATKQGLIDARWDGQNRLIGRYLNLSTPEITRPWVGLIVDAARIDGEHSGGRIDFRR